MGFHTRDAAYYLAGSGVQLTRARSEKSERQRRVYMEDDDSTVYVHREKVTENPRKERHIYVRLRRIGERFRYFSRGVVF